MKVIAIEESPDLSEMQLDELMGALRTYEMKLKKDASEKKNEVSEGTTFAGDQNEQITVRIKSCYRLMKMLDKQSLEQWSITYSVCKENEFKECNGYDQIKAKFANYTEKEEKVAYSKLKVMNKSCWRFEDRGFDFKIQI